MYFVKQRYNASKVTSGKHNGHLQALRDRFVHVLYSGNSLTTVSVRD